MPITSVSVRGHRAGLLACGNAAYNWEPARASTEFVSGWFSQRAEGGESDGMKERCKAEPLAIEHVRRHPPAGTDCPGMCGAAEVTESFSANRLSKRLTRSHQD